MNYENKTESDELKSRLKYLIKVLGLSNKEFAEKLDVTANYISILLSNPDKINFKFIYTIKKVFTNFNDNWLLTGIGNPLENDNHDIKIIAKDKENNLSKEEEITISLESLYNRNKIKIDNYVRGADIQGTITTKEDYKNLLNENFDIVIKLNKLATLR